MTSEKQIAANRLNAEKCTGPRTVEGKARSSQNALKTGIDAKSEIMQCESRAEYDELIAEFYRDYTPYNAAERSWVDIMIKSEWLNRRYMASAAAIWGRGFNNPDDRDFGLAFIRQQQTMGRVTQFLNSAVRNFDKAFIRLTALQSKRPARTPTGPILEGSTEITAEAAPETPEAPAQTPEPNIATEPLNPERNREMVSFLHFSDSPATLDPGSPVPPDMEDQQPPIAA